MAEKNKSKVPFWLFLLGLALVAHFYLFYFSDWNKAKNTDALSQEETTARVEAYRQKELAHMEELKRAKAEPKAPGADGKEAEVAPSVPDDIEKLRLQTLARTLVQDTHAPPVVASNPKAKVVSHVETVYTALEGESLRDVAIKKLGDGDLWPEIWKLNKTIVDKNHLKAGTVVQLPPPEARN